MTLLQNAKATAIKGVSYALTLILVLLATFYIVTALGNPPITFSSVLVFAFCLVGLISEIPAISRRLVSKYSYSGKAKVTAALIFLAAFASGLFLNDHPGARPVREQRYTSSPSASISTSSEQSPDEQNKYDYSKEDAKLIADMDHREIITGLVRGNLIDPESARFGGISFDDNKSVACIEVNAKNKMGGYTGTQYARLTRMGRVWSLASIDEDNRFCY